MDPLSLFIAALLAGISFLLCMQMLIAYRRVRNSKLLFLALGFALFLFEGMLLLVGQVWLTSVPSLSMSRELMILSLLALVLLYAGTAKG